ncbi:MAG: 3-deoxy-7-phosphoheptulonate synthase, partial [Chloroflexi bacterium]|nr:3-deoxy-7-phosphoheptulonate synthase [Chloroflexota bacterium]
MIVVMNADATKNELDSVLSHVREAGLKPSVTYGAERNIVGVVGGAITSDLASSLERLPGVMEILRVSR